VTVLVVGNCTVDLSFAVPRFPQAGETVLAQEKHVDLGGKGANQALVAHRFGAAVRLAAPIGTDADGDWAVARLAATGLDTGAILRCAAPTDQSILYVTPDGENMIVSSHAAAASATPAWAEAAVTGLQADAAAATLLVQGNLPEETTRAALAAARGLGMRTMLNPAPIQYGYDRLFPLADIAIVNAVEARTLGRRDDPVEGARAIRDGGVPVVIVTLGSRGALVLDGDGERAFPAPKVTAVDTVGAGDTFCGALVACLDRGIAMASAVAVAVQAAALTVTRKGTQSSFPDAGEAAALIARHAETSGDLR
jgi:ribokinase